MPVKTKNTEQPIQFPFKEQRELDSNTLEQRNEKISYPSDNYIISKDIYDNVLSRYGDNSYNLKPYSSTKTGNSIIYFNSIEGVKYQNEARKLWFLCYRFGAGRNNNNLSVLVLYSRFIGVIKPLCKFAKHHNKSTFHVLETKKLLTQFIFETNTSLFNQNIIATLNLYHFLSAKIDFKVAIVKKHFTIIQKRNMAAKANLKQTELIPPRLYGVWLNKAWAIINEFEKNSKGITYIIHEWVKECGNNPEEHTRKIRSENWGLWIKVSGLKELSSNRLFYNNRKKFTAYLSAVMRTCKGLIHFYSGMRSDEVLSLNYHCLSIDKVHKRKRARLIGNTTKYIGNKKQAQWVTTHEIERVITLLQSIVKPISSLTNASLAFIPSKGKIPCPLFLSTNFLISSQFRKKYPNGQPQSWRMSTHQSFSINSLFNKELMRITEEDIQYLEKFEPEHNWRQSKYAVGNIWHLKSHQFRRSLAVYSAQSGLVSIGSLQAQLKHLCREVTFYYENNAERAGNIFNIESGNHMAYEFLREKPIADYTAWVWQILFSDEKLDGTNGRVIECKIKADTPEQLALILQDRKKTIKQFENGQRAYAETPLGGCETTTPCDKKLMHSITACIDCTKADLKPSKVSRTIDSMTIFVNSLTPGSVEHRTERSELDQLIKLQERMEKNNAA